MNASIHEEWLTGLEEYESPDDVARRYAEKTAQVVPGVSSGALLEAMENPEVFQEVARADLYVQMALMRRQAQDPRFSPSQRLDYMKRLAEMGKVAQPERDTHGTANLPTINIVLPGSGHNVQLGGSAPEKDVTEAAQRVA